MFKFKLDLKSVFLLNISNRCSDKDEISAIAVNLLWAMAITKFARFRVPRLEKNRLKRSNCGYFIRLKLKYFLLQYKYNIHVSNIFLNATFKFQSKNFIISLRIINFSKTYALDKIFAETSHTATRMFYHIFSFIIQSTVHNAHFLVTRLQCPLVAKKRWPWLIQKSISRNLSMHGLIWLV